MSVLVWLGRSTPFFCIPWYFIISSTYTLNGFFSSWGSSIMPQLYSYSVWWLNSQYSLSYIPSSLVLCTMSFPTIHFWESSPVVFPSTLPFMIPLFGVILCWEIISPGGAVIFCRYLLSLFVTTQCVNYQWVMPPTCLGWMSESFPIILFILGTWLSLFQFF